MKRNYGLLIVAGAGLAATVTGAVVGWKMFGSPGWADLVSDSGSTADWAAAIGTWVIGVAAAYYAHQAHQQRELEIREKRLADLERRDAYLAGVMLRGIGINSISADIRQHLAIPLESRYILHLRDLMSGLEEDARDVAFSEEVLSALPSEAVMKLSSINGRAEGLRRLMKSVNGYLSGSLLGVAPPAGDTLVRWEDDEMVRKMLEPADEICALYKQYQDALFAAKAETEIAIRRLRWA